MTVSLTILSSNSLLRSSAVGGGGAVASTIVDITLEGENGVDVGVMGSGFERMESRDTRSVRVDSVGRGGAGIRLDNLVQKESLEASVLAIGELVSESSE